MAQDNRTEKATPRRRQKARDQGQYAYSNEFTAATVLLFASVALYYTFRQPDGFRLFFESNLIAVSRSKPFELDVVPLVQAAGTYFLRTILPVVAAAVAGALVASVIQGLPVFPSENLLKWELLNPIQGLSRLKTRVSWLQWARVIVMTAAVCIVCWRVAAADWAPLTHASASNLVASSTFLRSFFVKVLGYSIGAAFVIGVLDLFASRWQFEQSIRMTKDEVKEDSKATEGNPQVRGKIRSIQRDQARKRMMSRVREADVIVTNPTEYAVALEYKPDQMAAPKVIAKGRGWLARRIKEEGREHDIPTVENVPLARALYRSVEIDQEIPPELYKTVAEVLAYVFRARRKLRAAAQTP